jgi:hypothetical protein
MDKPIRFTISIPPKDVELSDFMMKKVKQNGMSVSAYIRNLIRRDMDTQVEFDFEEIYQYVARRLKESGLVLSVNNNNGSLNNAIDEIDKDIILDLF